jgi:hypothetical protein
MQYVNPDVATICTGLAASMGAVLLTAGSAKKRSGLPHSRIMIHQPYEWNAGTGFGYGNLPKTDFGGQKGPLQHIRPSIAAWNTPKLRKIPTVITG